MKDKNYSSPSYKPLYEQIKVLLTQSLIGGEWGPGDMIPSEIELASRYKVSQGTVRKAIDALATEHILLRRQGKGTFVATHSAEGMKLRFLRLTSIDGQKEFLKNVKSKIRELNDYVAKNAEYVGDQFVSEVRSIHYDKKKKRNIYGNATLEETKELQEEGIDVATIPWAPKEDA